MGKARILIVDDDTRVRGTLLDILEHEGYEVSAAGGAAAALKEGEQHNFDLLLADIKMPGMDGLELVQKFRELNPQIASILITGYPSFETMTTAIQQGAYDYIIKPVDKKELCTAVAAALVRKEPSQVKEKQKAVAKEAGALAEELTQNEEETVVSLLSPADMILTLRNSELFKELGDDELQTIAYLCQEETYQVNQVIYQQGEPSEKLYVIEQGSVALNRFIEPHKQAFVTIDILGEGRGFGWTALLEPHVHSTSAMCCKLTRVLAINGVELRLVLEREPRLGFEVIKRLANILGNRLIAGYHTLESKL